MDKRNFIKTGLTASLAGLVSPFSLSGFPDAGNQTILFQGDSITDAGRDKAQYYANNASGLGTGYAHMAGATLLERYPDRHLRIYNRGISGHKVFQLAGRWEDDALQLKPDVMSILIGVNDFWHMLNGNYDGTVAVYENDLRNLLQRTKDALPGVQLILGEPFVVKGGAAVGNGRWVTEFPAFQSACRKVATEFKASFIPYQNIFDNVLSKGGAAYWCPDGVHPSLAGARLMANAWISIYEKLG
ncbi:MAG: SGNH/GDSL hydrolase family protein [Saprospiraceae bacterium]|nr:SGNH/GDSL hydrolase family protein [Saprospiraceae bacterium]